MFKNKINRILHNNQIVEEDFDHKLYNTMLLGVFEAVCKDIKKRNVIVEEKERYRKNPDKLSATKILINRYINCELDNEDYEFLKKYFHAFFQNRLFLT